jgi:hypothetical protein
MMVDYDPIVMSHSDMMEIDAAPKCWFFLISCHMRGRSHLADCTDEEGCCVHQIVHLGAQIQQIART